MFKYILLILAAVVLYKLIFDLIIPVYRASRNIKRQFRDINQQMQERMKQGQSAHQQQPTFQKQETRPAKEDYIDFEEVK